MSDPRKVGRDGKYDPLVTEGVSKQEKIESAEDMEEFIKSISPANIHNDLSQLESNIAFFRGKNCTDGQEPHIKKGLDYISQTRDYIEAKNAEMAAFYALRAMQELMYIVLIHWELPARVGEANLKVLHEKKYSKEDLDHLIDQLCEKYPTHNITWIRDKLGEMIGLSRSQINRTTGHYNPRK